MWKNTLIVLVPDHLGAYPRPVENPLEGHTIPLILIGGAVKEPRVVDTYASQIDIAATLLSQLGLPHDDFTFSKNIFNPSSPPLRVFHGTDTVWHGDCGKSISVQSGCQHRPDR